MSTNDHTVPQFYLRRFARKSRGAAHQIVTAPADDLDAEFVTSVRNVAAVNGFHWGTDPDGVPHHTMEELMTSIERAAAPAFSEVLDTAWALPERWPPKLDTRVRLSWWVAAQILRSTRQRHRLDLLADQAAAGGLQEALDPAAGPLQRFTRNNRHLAFISDHLAPLAAIVGSKPWGIGFSDACMPTSDAPVVIMNGQDDEDQVLSAAYWDLLVPLDPHRFLLMPTPGSQRDPSTLVDHRVKFDGGFGLVVWELLWAAADQHVFWHPEHMPHALGMTPRERGPRLPRPWVGETHAAPEVVMTYGAMSPGTTVERRWLEEHPHAPRPDLLGRESRRLPRSRQLARQVHRHHVGGAAGERCPVGGGELGGRRTGGLHHEVPVGQCRRDGRGVDVDAFPPDPRAQPHLEGHDADPPPGGQAGGKVCGRVGHDGHGHVETLAIPPVERRGATQARML